MTTEESLGKGQGQTNRLYQTLLGQGMLYTVGTLAPILVTVLITPFLTRIFSPEDYGTIAVAIAFFQFVSTLIVFGLPTAITRNSILGDAKLQGGSHLVLTGTGVATVLSGLLLLSLPIWGTWVFTEDQTVALAPAIVSSLGLALVLLTQAFFRATEQVVTFVIISILASLIGPLLGLLNVILTSPVAIRYLWLLAFGQLSVGVLAVVLVLRRATPKGDLKTTRAAYRIALPTVPHQISLPFLTAATVALAGNMLGSEASGQTQLAILIGTAPLILLNSMNNAWAPMIYRAGDAERAGILVQSTRVVAALSFLMVLGFLAVYVPFATLMAGESLAGAGFLPATLTPLIGTPFMVIYLANIHLVMRAGNTGALAFTTPVSAIVSFTAVTVSAQAFTVPPLLLLTAAIGMFYVLQSGFSVFLRHRLAEAKPSSLHTVVYLSIAVLLIATELMFGLSAWWYWVGLIAGTVVVVWIEVLSNRRNASQL